MTIDNVKDLLNNTNHKITHKLFSENEYITNHDTEYYMDEQGYLIPKYDFWKYRSTDLWNEGWEIKE